VDNTLYPVLSPANELERLAALVRLHILDTPPEERYDRITRLAQRLLGSPMAMVTFIDADRQWFKSRQGIQATQLPRERSICAYTLLEHEALLISDTTQDARVKDNPLVTGGPKIRSYAGRAIRAPDGSPVGTLCVMDLQPRQFTVDDQHLLADLAAMVEDELQLTALNEIQAALTAANAKIEGETQRLASLEQTLNRQVLVFDNITESVIVTDLTGQIIDCNPAAERLYGYLKHEILGQTPALWEKTARTPLQQKLIAASLSQRRAWTGEVRFVHRGGFEGTAEVVIQPLIDADDVTFAHIEVSHDITQRKRIDQQLKTVLSVQQATFESTAEGVLVVDQAGHIVDFNRVFREMWRIPDTIMATRDESQAISFVLNQLVDPEAFVRNIEALYQTPEAVVTDVIELKDGRILERYTQPQRLDVVTIGRVWNFRDVTAYRAAETKIRLQNESLMQANQELMIARKEADDANAAKGQFLATISHELRTPLNAIIGFAQLQVMGIAGELNAEQLDYDERIIKNGHYLLSMIDELLDLSKLEAGRLELVNHSFDLRDFLNDVIRHNRILADNKGLIIDMQIDPGLPSIIVGDQARLQQIVLNLFSNAVKFTSIGSVTVDARPGDHNTWLLTVTDTGIGIAPDKHTLIFEEFRQVDHGPTRQYGGTGLGLAIVKRLVHIMGGTIQVTSALEQGSTFVVTLPLVTQPDAVHA